MVKVRTWRLCPTCGRRMEGETIEVQGGAIDERVARAVEARAVRLGPRLCEACAARFEGETPILGIRPGEPSEVAPFTLTGDIDALPTARIQAVVTRGDVEVQGKAVFMGLEEGRRLGLFAGGARLDGGVLRRINGYFSEARRETPLLQELEAILRRRGAPEA